MRRLPVGVTNTSRGRGDSLLVLPMRREEEVTSCWCYQHVARKRRLPFLCGQRWRYISMLLIKTLYSPNVNRTAGETCLRWGERREERREEERRRSNEDSRDSLWRVFIERGGSLSPPGRSVPQKHTRCSHVCKLVCCLAAEATPPLPLPGGASVPQSSQTERGEEETRISLSSAGVANPRLASLMRLFN